MSLTIIVALTIWILSFGGILIVIRKKLPELNSISEKSTPFVKTLWNRKKIFNMLGGLSWEKFIHKSLLKIRILALKTENKTTAILDGIRKNSNSKDKDGDKYGDGKDSYWEKLKKSSKR